MSGIAGIARRYPTGVAIESLGRMAAAIRHRGPDGYGFYIGSNVGFTHVRLGVVDIPGGAQPLTNEDGRIVITYNGEIYNHRELRLELEGRGHVFRTRCDTEVLVHGYEEWGSDLLHRLNGQFAFAIYDRNRGTVFVARDRFGVRPLFYAQRSGDFYFASEIKAILASGEVDAALDARGLDEVLTFGAARHSRTPFSGIASLEPGTYGIWQDGALWLRHYYELDFPEAVDEPPDAFEQLDEIMLRSVGIRLRADLPVGAHISGGLNSAIAASLAASASKEKIRSFSIDIGNAQSGGSERQRAVAEAIGSVHAFSSIGDNAIAQSFPDVLWHAETPLFSAAPVAMYHLARLTKESGTSVVVRGDGGDEVFLRSALFKEVSLRLPEVGEPHDLLFSHLPRFLGARMGRFYTAEFGDALAGVDVIAELRASLPTRFFAWSPLNRTAYLEMTTRLSPYVLSSCADRMSMAHGVEARYPFLDHRLFEFAAALPTRSKLSELPDKELLRCWASRVLPFGLEPEDKSSERARVPDLFRRNSPAWINDHLSTESVRRAGIFSPAAVEVLLHNQRSGSAKELPWHQPLLGVLSTQLWYSQFIESSIAVAPLPIGQASVILREGAATPHHSFVANRADSAS
ncbi:MAG TPA: asparagine synthase (glutamine-hydrolyzing) [Gemmatimonadaceae bacterium]|nr:asparagine synthase (glutamine-hydrolyzing) [Gemmatimonadaceae bacterium]